MLITEITHRLFNAQVNVEAIYPLQGLGTECAPDWLEDLIDFISDCDENDPLFLALPVLKNLVNREEFPAEEEFLDALQYGNEKGFILYGTWEVRDYRSESTFFSGPGHRRIIWTYADEIDAGFETIIAAAEADHERAREKVGAA